MNYHSPENKRVKCVLSPIEIHTKNSIWKHIKTNEISFWKDVMSVDKNWYPYELILVDENPINEGDFYIFNNTIFQCYGRHLDMILSNVLTQKKTSYIGV